MVYRKRFQQQIIIPEICNFPFYRNLCHSTTKIYLDNTNLIYSLANDNSNTGNIRETFFLNQLSVKYDVIVSPVADFRIGDYTFEVGGKNKGLKQIQGIDKAFIVKDDIELGYLNTIPLWQFGLTY